MAGGVDATRFVKMFLDGIKQACDLSKAGMQVFGTGQTLLHCGVSKCPTHSVHFFGSMMYMSFLRRMAALGHSNSQAPQAVQRSSTQSMTSASS